MDIAARCLYCARKVGADDMSDLEVHLEAERIVVEEFVRQQHADITSHSDILVLDADVADSRLSSSKKSQKKSVKPRYVWKHINRMGVCQTPPPLGSARLNFVWHLTVLRTTLVGVFFKYAYTQKDVINGHFVRRKQTGNEM